MRVGVRNYQISNAERVRVRMHTSCMILGLDASGPLVALGQPTFLPITLTLKRGSGFLRHLHTSWDFLSRLSTETIAHTTRDAAWRPSNPAVLRGFLQSLGAYLSNKCCISSQEAQESARAAPLTFNGTLAFT